MVRSSVNRRHVEGGSSERKGHDGGAACGPRDAPTPSPPSGSAWGDTTGCRWAPSPAVGCGDLTRPFLPADGAAAARLLHLHRALPRRQPQTPAHACPLPTLAPSPWASPAHECPLPTCAPSPHRHPPSPPAPHTSGQARGGQPAVQAACPLTQRHVSHSSCHSLPAWPRRGGHRAQSGQRGCNGAPPTRGSSPLAPLTSWSCPRCRHSQRAAGTQCPVLLR